MGLQPQPWLGYPAFWALLLLLEARLFPASAACAIVLMASFLGAMWPRGSLKERALGMMATFFGLSYLAWAFHAAVRIRFEFGSTAGLQWTLLLLAVIWSGDTAAMLGGKALGRTRLSPQISPKKTNEGAAAGLLGGILVAFALQRFVFDSLPLAHVLAAAALVGSFGQLGDLAESLLKRAAGTKDSSRLVPGHGGVLDRVDSLLFAFPVLYIYLYFLYSTWRF
jgi:phosphatidate cytidylyltransferase